MSTDIRTPKMNPDPDDPIAYFIEDMRYYGKADRTVREYKRVLRRFESHLSDRDKTPAEADHRDCLTWVSQLRDGLADSTVSGYAYTLHRFYKYMFEIGAFDSNPMAVVVAEMDEQVDSNPTRRDISVAEMREYVSKLDGARDRAVVMTLLKTGIRNGELCNLDLRDLSLDHPVTDKFDVETRGVLDGRRDTLFIDPDISRGDVVNGVYREESNKRERGTLLPVDGELKHELVRWLETRPVCSSPALFVDTDRDIRDRITSALVQDTVREAAKEMGWYKEDGDASENVTPHYFRHFFTTHLRHRIGDRGVVKYLRGDVADDAIDTYTHNWNGRVRDHYLENIYSLT